MASKGKSWLDRIKGDKVIWIVVIFLTLLSVIALFSSTSLQPTVMKGIETRVDVFLEQLKFVAGGFLFMYLIYKFCGVKVLRALSSLGFIGAAFLLLLLFIKPQWSFLRVETLNEATRNLRIFGFQVHVFEVVKVAMVMYLAWAVDAWKGHNFRFANWISSSVSFMGWFSKPFWQGVFYIFLPICLVSIGLISGSVSTVLFVGMIMFATIFIGGFSIRDTFIYGAILVALLITGFGLHAATRPAEGAEPNAVHKMTARIYGRVDKAAKGRMSTYMEDLSPAEQVAAAESYDEKQRLIDKYTQPEGAKIAIHEGSILGKGPGRSSQKYRVPLMFGDYMYSFLIEEYGLWMAILVIIMYVSLLARGSRIAMMCTKIYSRTVVGGLTLLISAQGMMHMAINVGLFPITGQTLPMVSDGKGSLIMFYIAFGVILSISKAAKKPMDKKIQEAESIIPESEGVEVQTAEAMVENIEE